VTGVRRSAVLLAAAGWLGTGGAALAEERVVQIGREGVRPQVLRLEPGDTLRFVNEDPTFAYRAQSTGGPWRFDSGPTALLEDDFAVPSALTRPGTYTYRVAQDAPFRGSVVLGDAAASSAAPATPAAPPAAGPPPPTATPASGAAPAVPGRLAGPRTDRPLGLPVVVAAVLVLGVASLLLRLLLALPVLSDRSARL
jgi:plastocyanin